MENLEKEKQLMGFMDLFKAAAPTIGKVVGGLWNTFVGADGTQRYGFVQVDLGTDEKGEAEKLPLVNVNGRIMAYNTSLAKDLTLNFPRKLNRYNGEVCVLKPFSKLDVTDNFSDCSASDVERFNVQSTDASLAVSSDGLVNGLLSCVGYITKKMLEGRIFKLTSHIFLQIVGQDLKITLSSGLSLESAPSVNIMVKDGAENKKFLNVQALPETVAYGEGLENAKGAVVLKGALAGYDDDDELELDITVNYSAPKGMLLGDRRGESITYEDLCVLKQLAR